MASPAAPDVQKCGYLKKHKHGHRRFFVLREPGGGRPARLEYYDSEKKWRSRSAARRVISLGSCLSISKRADAKHRHLIALYTKDEYLALAADDQRDQESWYGVLRRLVASPLPSQEEEADAYREVWQVTVKSRGLGQARHLTGVHRLCLCSRAISFVKLNSEVAAVRLQLMNIRRCGHSDSFFFIEVGRSASIGPGELWMQADDAVVAQNIHETILEAMKAMKELSEFRPRSKSQSSGTNPISVPTRRHLSNLPPSQTGLLRRSRTAGVAAVSPVGRPAPCRIRTASEGDGTPLSPRSEAVGVRPCRPCDSSVPRHGRCVPVPVPGSHSPPSTVSLVSLSSSGGNGSAVDGGQCPASCGASVSGSPSDAGFMSCDDYGSSPAEAKRHLAHRSDTPESICDTPPSRDGDLCGYVMMDRLTRSRHQCRWVSRDEGSETAHRKRTYSLTTPSQQRAPSQVSSASLDEYTLMRATFNSGPPGPHSRTASPRVSYPEDYGDVRIGSSKSSSDNTLDDSGYMPMTPGVAPQGGENGNYVPMGPMIVSAPKQIVRPGSQAVTTGNGYKTTSPGSCSLDDSGYMRMWCGSKLSVESSDGRLSSGDYMNMLPIEPCVSVTPPDFFVKSGESPRGSSSFTSLPRSYKAQLPRNGDTDQYVVMSLQSQKIVEEPNYCEISADLTAPTSGSSPLPVTKGAGDCVGLKGRAARPNRLQLDSVRTLPCMNEHPMPSEPRSPGEYINIDFGENAKSSPPSQSSDSLASSMGSTNSHTRSPFSDYMNTDLGTQSPKAGDAPADALNAMYRLSLCQPEKEEYPKTQVDLVRPPGTEKDDYTEMAFGVGASPKPVSQTFKRLDASRPGSGVQRLALRDQELPGVEAFLVSSPLVDPDRGAKVIRVDPQGRRRHSSETFSSTTTVTPVFPSFAHDAKRHNSASVENVSVWNSEGSDEEYGSAAWRETSAGFPNGLNYIALNLMDENLGTCKNLVKFKAASYCKGDISGIHSGPFVGLGFKETATTVKD